MSDFVTTAEQSLDRIDLDILHRRVDLAFAIQHFGRHSALAQQWHGTLVILRKIRSEIARTGRIAA